MSDTSVEDLHIRVLVGVIRMPGESASAISLDAEQQVSCQTRIFYVEGEGKSTLNSHQALYRMFEKHRRDFDLIVKLDPDMRILNRQTFGAVYRLMLANDNVSAVSLPLSDMYFGEVIMGINFWDSGTKFLGVFDPVFCDRVITASTGETLKVPRQSSISEYLIHGNQDNPQGRVNMLRSRIKKAAIHQAGDDSAYMEFLRNVCTSSENTKLVTDILGNELKSMCESGENCVAEGDAIYNLPPLTKDFQHFAAHYRSQKNWSTKKTLSYFAAATRARVSSSRSSKVQTQLRDDLTTNLEYDMGIKRSSG